MIDRVLVAAVGNIFLGDDGFGSDVARLLASRPRLPGVVVRDFGTRVLDLEMALESADAGIVVDVVERNAPPGTLFVLDPVETPSEHERHGGNAHTATTTDVIRRMSARAREGARPRVLRVVGCVPRTFGEEGVGALGLSEEVANAVRPAADLVIALALALAKEVACTSSP